MADRSSFTGLRALTNHINIAGALRWAVRNFHREPVIGVSILLGVAGTKLFCSSHIVGPIFVYLKDPADPVRKLDVRKRVMEDAGRFSP